MPGRWRIPTSQIIGIFSAREFPLFHTLGAMLASWRSVLSFLSYPSSKCEGVRSREELQGYSEAICDVLRGRSCPSRIADIGN